ncbi:hypothetical protein PoB_001192200 [Plakobranchus ocellatus]|uniref:Uncharacterized protein n=1 Tax=Plakobranchus ocellatus TaxID=259542 RepID=A0AAV3YTG2_9GAST|nr:hypothetical protein PoB_001192200 [Plakobranchus ocellatus]
MTRPYKEHLRLRSLFSRCAHPISVPHRSAVTKHAPRGRPISEGHRPRALSNVCRAQRRAGLYFERPSCRVFTHTSATVQERTSFRTQHHYYCNYYYNIGNNLCNFVFKTTIIVVSSRF